MAPVKFRKMQIAARGLGARIAIGAPDSNPKARPPGFEPGACWAHGVQLGPTLY